MLGNLLETGAADLVSDEALDTWMLREAVTYSHICGTCRIGPSLNAMAVVDQRGRIHGLEGRIVVADAPIMPHLVSTPINSAVLVIGERMADPVKQDIQEGQRDLVGEAGRAASIVEEFMAHSPTVSCPLRQSDFGTFSRIGQNLFQASLPRPA